jgi:hypothetical protein
MSKYHSLTEALCHPESQHDFNFLLSRVVGVLSLYSVSPLHVLLVFLSKQLILWCVDMISYFQRQIFIIDNYFL